MNIDLDQLLPLQAHDFIGQSVAILGIKGSGKSNTAAVLMEELLTANIPIQIVDIAGEYYTLKSKFPRVTVVGRSWNTQVDISLTQNNTEKTAEKAYRNGVPVVIDLSGIPSDARPDILLPWLSATWRAAGTSRIPTVLFLEEAHNWIPQRQKTAVSGLLVDYAAEGRKRGLSLVMIGQRSARIDKDTLTQADIAFLHRVRHPIDLQVYTAMIPRSGAQVKDMVNRLKTGDALVLFGDKVLRATIRPRETQHAGATPGFSNIPKNQLSLLDLI